ncbi:MAG TPA: hypothetical protein ENG83_10820 [Nitrospirae bacterium]|nr:hypothetical protein BMS3Abin06_01559 [bacterium BMS3Abin06]HDH12664.1 hypothetical protein [Nitrospirota bacterium]HDY99972.1 hypothetical protein [Nitrospirota bacterium]
MISKEEKKELLRLAGSSTLKEDMRHLSATRHNPVMVNGKVSIDRLITFLSEYNEFINHEPKPFKPMIEREMKL